MCLGTLFQGNSVTLAVPGCTGNSEHTYPNPYTKVYTHVLVIAGPQPLVLVYISLIKKRMQEGHG